ncbi:MAG: tripartite tricarboxylate transporter substrate binding protein, partial [Betaproteobacteria bacterium]|nr:tripartite tricarboxylate transporter substrate binding protein [Betaproteobacteria bacterium]
MLRSAQAQAERYPIHPITMVVPFPPGGVADTVGRPMAEAMGRMLGQPIVIENKAGAGGALGMAVDALVNN